MVCPKKISEAPTSGESVPDFCQRIVRNNIFYSENIRLLGLDSEFSELLNLVLRTVDRAESNSALIIGPRGSGKSSVSTVHYLFWSGYSHASLFKM